MQDSHKTLQAYRDELLTRLLWLVAILGTFRILVGADGLKSFLNLPALLLVVIIAVAFARRVNFKLRAILLILIPYLISINSLTDFGIAGASRMFGSSFVILAGALFGVVPGIIALVVYLVSMGICGWLIMQGVIEVFPDARDISSQSRYWVQSSATFIVVTGAIFYSIMYLIQSLNRQIEELRVESEEKDAARKAEQESEAHYRLLAENVHDIIWTMDLNGQMTYVSPSVTQVRGFTPDEVIAGGMAWIGPPENSKLFIEVMQGELALEESETADPNRSRTVEMQLLRADGSLFDAEVVMSFLRDEDGEAVSILGVTRDVTERTKLERQLQQSQKMESIGQLAGGMAHDFNNLLMVILGYGDLAANTNDSSIVRTYMEEVGSAARRGAEMTKQLLAFSRRQIMDLSPVDLSALITELRGMIRPIVPENIEVELHIPEKPLYTLADKVQLVQVLTNLVINARDAMVKGGTLQLGLSFESLNQSYVRAHPWAKRGKYAVIRVTDTGEGMPDDVMARIFEPFYTTKPEGQGTGLGLAMVFGTVKQLKGFIHVYSEVDKGTEFKLYLPHLADPSQAQAPKVENMNLTGTETILLVEDETQVRELGSVILSNAGYSVIQASDGAEGLEIYNERKDEIDLLLLDVVMPKMGGEGLMKAVREMGDDVPILFTSGYSGSAIHTDFILQEGLELISKPYGPDLLKRKIREVLDRGSSVRRPSV